MHKAEGGTTLLPESKRIRPIRCELDNSNAVFDERYVRATLQGS